jgi:hypothetical protein
MSTSTETLMTTYGSDLRTPKAIQACSNTFTRRENIGIKSLACWVGMIGQSGAQAG